MADTDRVPLPPAQHQAAGAATHTVPAIPYQSRDASDSDARLNVKPSTFQKILVILLSVLGVQLWLVLGHGDYGRDFAPVFTIVCIAAVGLIPPVRRFAGELIDRLREVRPSTRAVTSVAIAVVASVSLYVSATWQGRAFFVYIQDEFAYVIQMRMLAHGRLWMPPHQLGPAFENFYLLHRPVYAPIYFPGTAMLYVPAIWLHLPLWLLPLAVAGAVVGLTYRVVTESVDGLCGALAVVVLVSLPTFRWMSLRVMSAMPLLLFGLLMIWAYLRWRKNLRWRWAIAIGVFAGWAAIIRPVDAVVFALPVGIAMIIVAVARRCRGTRWWIATAACLVAGAAPFLTLQLIFNKGVTGHWQTTPYQLYHAQDAPGAGYGFATVDASATASSTLLQKQLLYTQEIKGKIAAHQIRSIGVETSNRLSTLSSTTLPHAMLLMLVPLAALPLARRRGWPLWGSLPSFVVLFIPFTFFLPHYTLTAAPAVALTVALGAIALISSFSRMRAFMSIAIVAFVAVLSMTTWRTFNRLAFDDPSQPGQIQKIDETLATLNDTRALVFFKFFPERSLDIEPVYNIGVAYPDDANVIRAHDLGPELNLRAIHYYAQRDAGLNVYQYDEKTNALNYLGVAGALDAPIKLSR